MKKRCTESACRREFDPKRSNGVCPFCGRDYRRVTGYGVQIFAICDPLLKAVKVLREHLDLPLAECIRMLWKLPSVAGNGLSRKDAQKLCEALAATGCRARVTPLGRTITKQKA